MIKDKKHLKELIKDEVAKNGDGCDLNHINLFDITDMSYLFNEVCFNRDLFTWNNMGLADMDSMFNGCSAQKPWWYVEIENKEERMEEVKRRRKVMDLNKSLNESFVFNKNKGKKKVIKL